MIGLVAATRRGQQLARHLAQMWPDARLFDGPAPEAVAETWQTCQALVLFMATGVAARLVAPLLADKRSDPGIVCVDDGARFAVALAGGHEGGANALAVRVADALGATPVVTTASDALRLPSLDDLGADLGFRLDPRSDLAAVGAAVVSGERVTLVEDQRWPLPPLPPNIERAPEPREPCVVVSDRTTFFPHPAAIYRPPSLTLGVGCASGASATEILTLVDTALTDARLSPLSVVAVASIEVKRHEAGLLEAAAQRGWTLRFHSAEELASEPVPNPSADVARAVGTPSVAEAAVLAQGAALIVPKRRSERVTVAVGRLLPRGRLYVVGLGPGEVGLLPPAARDALARSELIVGLDRYVEGVRALLRPGTQVEASGIGSEVARAERAVAAASAGIAVALVSGGDAGVYAMASPALERATADIDVVCVPGITASLAAAALLGSPLGHDHCSISLSDLLTPWEVIRRRIKAAAEGDFVVAFYNPRSTGRCWQLEEARLLLLEHRKPETPVGVVSDAYRPGQRIRVTTLGDLDVERIGMTTIVIAGNSQTRVVAGRIVTPRGYA